MIVNFPDGRMICEDSLMIEVSKQTDFSDQLIELTLAFWPMETHKFDN